MNSSDPTATKRTWTIVQFELRPDHEEMAAWLMMHNGATGCEIKEAESDHILLQATFPQSSLKDEELRKQESQLEEYGLSSSLRSLKVSSLEEQDWLEKWKEGFQPFTIGGRVTICPPWWKEKLSENLQIGRHVIYIEPGLAFGTGLHATTQYCIRCIEKQGSIGSALDVGTGSGILAIACALIHPGSKVLALDIDPQAIKTARENLEINQV